MRVKHISMTPKLFRLDNRTDSETTAPNGTGVSLPNAFVNKLDAQLRRLADLHLRVSLARLDREVIPGSGDTPTQQIVDGLYDPSSIVGVGGDGSIVAAFLGPREQEGTSGDQAVAARIERLFTGALAAAGIDEGHVRQNLTIVHGWTDEIHDVPGLALALERQRHGRKRAAEPKPRTA
jgi:hypothetical protein